MMDRTSGGSIATVRITLELTKPALQAASARLWQLPGLAHRYPAYLCAMHGVIRASVPLMELAAQRCADRAADDPVAGPLRQYLLRHIEQERGHDDWLLADLAALDCDLPRRVAAQPSPTVAQLAGAQYYWIEHYHPVALMGYIAVLEGNAPTPELGDWIVRTAGIPEGAVRTVREHAELDARHAEAAFHLLEALPLTAAQKNAVTISGLHTAETLIRLFADVVRAT
jgi:hypothetical protein